MADSIDDSRYTLTEHLTELRGRLLRSLLGIVATTSVAAWFAADLLDYAVKPLTSVLADKNRVETVLVHSDATQAQALTERLEDFDDVRFSGLVPLPELRERLKAAVSNRRPVDLVLVSGDTASNSEVLLDDVLDGITPPPSVVYLVKSPQDPLVAELQLEGAALITDPPRKAVLARMVRRAAASAGKAVGNDKLVVLSPLDPFFAYLKIALVIGLFAACPIWLYQAWRFVAPGLYSSEKKVVVPAVVSASVLFLAGGSFAYFVMFPLMFDMLINTMMPDSLMGQFTVDKYLSLLLLMTLVFGVVFELPLIIALLSVVGLVNATMLRKFRRYAIVLSFVVAAVATPADPLSQIMMAIPLVVFYELGILAAVILGKKKPAAAEEEDPEDAVPTAD